MSQGEQCHGGKQGRGGEGTWVQGGCILSRGVREGLTEEVTHGQGPGGGGREPGEYLLPGLPSKCKGSGARVHLARVRMSESPARLQQSREGRSRSIH